MRILNNLSLAQQQPIGRVRGYTYAPPYCPALSTTMWPYYMQLYIRRYITREAEKRNNAGRRCPRHNFQFAPAPAQSK